MSKFKIGDIVTGKHKNDSIYGLKCEIIDFGVGEYYQTVVDGTDETVTYYAIRTLEEGNNIRKGAETNNIWREEDLTLIEESTFALQEILENISDFKERTKLKSDKVEIEILSNGGLSIKNIYRDSLGGDVMVFANDQFKIVERPLTLDDFDLEEEFKVLGCEGIFKKVKIFDNVCIARKWNDGSVCTYRPSSYFGEGDILIKINK